MRWFSYVAVYVLFWVLSAFAVMPWGVRSHDEDTSVERVPGQVTSAPTNFRPGRIVLRTTIVATALFALFFANLHYDWLDADAVQHLVPVPASLQSLTIYH